MQAAKDIAWVLFNWILWGAAFAVIALILGAAMELRLPSVGG